MATYTPLDFHTQVMDSNGDPLENGTIEFYKAGTTTALNVYSDDSGTSLGSTVTLNSWGMPESGGTVVTLYYEQSTALKAIFKDSAGAAIKTLDPWPASANFDSTSSAKLATIEESADVTDATNVGAVVNGSQEMFIRPQDMYLPTTGAAGAIAQVEGTATMPNYSGFPFSGAASTAEYVEFVVAFPKRYNLGTVTAQLYWSSAAVDTDGVVWNVRAVALSDSDPFAKSYGTAVSITDTLLGAAGDLHITSESSAITIGGAVADSDLVAFRIGRDPDNASDTATEDATLVGCKLRWTSDALNDA